MTSFYLDPMVAFSSLYYIALSCGYFAALSGWSLINRWKPALWNSDSPYHFIHPWREAIWALLAAVLTLGIGQLYSGSHLVPKDFIGYPQLAEAINQALIFLPFVLLLLLRRQPATTAWLSSRHIFGHVIAGLALALVAICIFVLVLQPSIGFDRILLNTYRLHNAPLALQVLLEDIAIAIVFVRLRAALGRRWFLITVMCVAFLFSASHYPSKLADGQSFLSATRDVLIDGALASGVIYVLQRSRDIVWFWCVHFAMDMMQFAVR